MMSPTPTCRIISMSRTTVHLHPGVDDETLQMFNITRMDLRLNAEMKSSALVRLEDEKKREFLMRLKFAIMGRNEEIRYLAIEVMRNLMKPSEMLKAEWSAELLRMDISDDIWRCLSSCNVPFLGLCYEVLTVFSNTQDYQVRDNRDNQVEKAANYLCHLGQLCDWDSRRDEMLMGVKFLHQITENRFNKVTEPEKNIAQSQIRTQNSLTDVESNCRVTGYFLQSCVEITFRLLKKDGLHTTFEAVDISLMTCLLALYCLNWEKFTESLAYDVFLGTSEDGSFMEIFRQIHVGRPREHRSSANSLMFSIFAELLQQLTEVSPEIMGILTKFCVKVELLSPPLQDFLHYGFSSKRLPTAGIDDWQHMLLTFMTLLAAKLQVVPEWLKATNPRNVLLKKTVAIVKKMRVNPTDRLSQMLLLCWHAVEPNFTPFNGFWEIDFSSIIRGLHGDIKTLNEGPLALNLCLIALVFEQKTFQLKMDFNLIRFNGYPIHLDLSGRLDTELEELMTLLCRVIHRNHQDPVAGAISLEALMRVIYWAVVAGRLRLLKGFVQWNPELIELLLPAVQAGQEKMFAYFAHFTGYKFVILVKEVIDRLFPRESPFGSALSGHLCKLLNRQFYEADVGGKIWAAWEAFWRSHL